MASGSRGNPAGTTAEPPPPPPSPRRRRRALALAAAVAASVALLLYAALVEPQWLEVTEHRVGSGPQPLVVLHLTDLHVTSFGRRERRVLELCAELRPDLVAITGDTVTAGTIDDPATADAVRAVLGGLSARLGVWACPGNHEDWSGGARVFPPSVRVLRGERASLLGGRLTVAGLGSARDLLPPPTAGLDLVLCHYPIALPRVAAAGHELLLAGHTHGGQVRLPGLGALWLPFDSGPYEQGWFEEGATRMYVSRGVGTSILPVRFLCRPEVAVLRLALP